MLGADTVMFFFGPCRTCSDYMVIEEAPVCLIHNSHDAGADLATYHKLDIRNYMYC